MKDTLRMAAVLMLVCAVSATALAVTHGQTQPVIEEQQQLRLEETQQKLLPEADTFEEEALDEEAGEVFYVGYDGEEQVGVIALVAQGGYSTDVEMMVAMNMDGEIQGLEILEHEETPGLGARITEEEFREQFEDKTMEDPISLDEDIEGITGATISGRAVTSGVRRAGEAISQQYLGEVDPVLDLAQVPDETYEGVGEGFGGDIRVEVVVQDGEIVSVEVLEHEESEGVAEPALEEIPAAIEEEQEDRVDAVSGATWTSEGIMEAVRDALSDYLVDPEEAGD